MGQKRIVRLFFEEPSRNFGIREIAKLAKVPKTSVSRHLKELLKEGLITRGKEGYSGNGANPFFKVCKKIYFLEESAKSGIIEFLQEKLYPRCIVVFGSFAKGEYVKSSDIDLFVQAKEKGIDLSRFEKRLNHKVSLFFEESFENISDELFNNIINGIKLGGYIKLR
ncbi:nucleotidyltransferase domain-containing protein [Candidatus Woesearchaeota archaeon]|nr:nucleotidyltransferase domain-containing protein [Candidatus Woesearchaeota archaeon]